MIPYLAHFRIHLSILHSEKQSIPQRWRARKRYHQTERFQNRGVPRARISTYRQQALHTFLVAYFSFHSFTCFALDTSVLYLHGAPLLENINSRQRTSRNGPIGFRQRAQVQTASATIGKSGGCVSVQNVLQNVASKCRFRTISALSRCKMWLFVLVQNPQISRWLWIKMHAFDKSRDTTRGHTASRHTIHEGKKQKMNTHTPIHTRAHTNIYMKIR